MPTAAVGPAGFDDHVAIHDVGNLQPADLRRALDIAGRRLTIAQGRGNGVVPQRLNHFDSWAFAELAQPNQIGETASDGATIHFRIASLPDVGIGMASSNDGPIDLEAPNPWSQTISSVDRIVLSGEMLPAGMVAPGDKGVPLLHFTLTNTYTVAKTLTELTVTNATSGPGSPSELDSEIEARRTR